MKLSIILLAIGAVSAADPSCGMNDKCGNGCTKSVTDKCKDGACTDMFGAPTPCGPYTNACGGNTYCSSTEFCGKTSNTCKGNNCQNRQAEDCSNSVKDGVCEPNGTGAGCPSTFKCELRPGFVSTYCGAGGSPTSGGSTPDACKQAASTCNTCKADCANAPDVMGSRDLCYGLCGTSYSMVCKTGSCTNAANGLSVGFATFALMAAAVLR